MDVYCRVSRVGKRKGESYRSPDIQREEAVRWIEREGLSVGQIITDEDVSGGKAVEDRGLAELIRRAEAGTSDGVVVYAMDRFGRDELDASIAVKRLHDAGTRVVSATEGIDSSRTDTGSKMALKMMLIIAEAYLDRVKGNWKHATTQALNDGIYIAARAPIGYARADGKVNGEDLAPGVERNGRLVVDEPAAAAVRGVFELRAAGASWKRCNRTLELALGRKISPSTARRIIHNRVYLGQVCFGEQIVEGAHKAIISEELWSAANNVRGPKLPKDGSVANKALLRGLVYCSTCGRKMGVGRMNKAGDASYVCNQKYTGGPCTTGGAASASSVDEHVLWLLANDTSGAAEAAAAEKRRALEAREAKVAAKAELEMWMEDTEASAATRKNMILKAEAKLEAARAELYDLPDPGEGDVVVLDGRPMLYEKWDDLAQEQKRAHLTRYVGRVTVTKSNRGRWQPISERIAVTWIDGSEPVIAA
jgi:DNA invertase Pin-like site-specific DNA recombinase